MKMADSVLLLLEFFEDPEVEYDEILRFKFDFSVASCYMRRNLNPVREYFENAIPLYFPDRQIQESFSNDERKLRTVYSRGHANRKNTTW